MFVEATAAGGSVLFFLAVTRTFTRPFFSSLNSLRSTAECHRPGYDIRMSLAVFIARHTLFLRLFFHLDD